MFHYLLAIIAGYLIGSIPFGLLIAKYAGKTDPRLQGSGNIGATNMARINGQKLGALTLICDMLKAVVVVIIVSTFYPEHAHLKYLAGLAVFLGHLYPAWLKFKGGKGVATGIGVVIGFGNIYTILFVVVGWLAVFFATRYSALAALVVFAFVPLVNFYFSSYFWEFLTLFIMSLFVFWRHKSNIRNLRNGTEVKM